MKCTLSKWAWIFVGILVIDLIRNSWAAAGVWVSPELVPDLFGIKKQMQEPMLLACLVIFTALSLLVVSVPRLRTERSLRVVGVVLFCEGLALFFHGFAIALTYIAAASAMTQGAQQGAEPDAGERNASSGSGGGAG